MVSLFTLFPGVEVSQLQVFLVFIKKYPILSCIPFSHMDFSIQLKFVEMICILLKSFCFLLWYAFFIP